MVPFHGNYITTYYDIAIRTPNGKPGDPARYGAAVWASPNYQRTVAFLLQTAQNVQKVALSPWLLLPVVFVVVAALAFNFPERSGGQCGHYLGPEQFQAARPALLVVPVVGHQHQRAEVADPGAQVVDLLRHRRAVSGKGS